MSNLGRDLLDRVSLRMIPIPEHEPILIQNLKTLGLWIFFLIYCSTFLFLPNVGLRLILEYLTEKIEKVESKNNFVCCSIIH